jgi:hypothetical protein
MAVDPRDIENGMKVDKNFLTPLELKAKRKVWDETYGKGDKQEDAIDAVLRAHKSAYKSEKGENRIEVLDIEGQFEKRCIYPDEYDEDDEAGDEIGLYNLIVAVVKNKKFCLYKTELKASRYKHKARKQQQITDVIMQIVLGVLYLVGASVAFTGLLRKLKLGRWSALSTDSAA